MDDDILKGMEEYLKSDDFHNECKKQFEAYDKDQSDYIETEELRVVLNEVAASLPSNKGKAVEVSDENLNNAMDGLDTNQDGRLSLDEFKVLANIVFMAKLQDEMKSLSQ